jgi:hypothetical protein
MVARKTRWISAQRSEAGYALLSVVARFTLASKNPTTTQPNIMVATAPKEALASAGKALAQAILSPCAANKSNTLLINKRWPLYYSLA